MIAPTQIQPQTLAQAPTPQADVQRKQQMMEAWRAFRGELPPPLKVTSGQTDDNVLSNRCEPIVEKVTSFLFGQVLAIEAADETPDTASEKQDFLDNFWGDDDIKMTRFSQAAINGGVCGQVFLKLIPAQGRMKYPRIVVMDPQLVRIVTDPDDCSLILAFVIEYPGGADVQKRQVITRIDPDGDIESTGEYDLEDTWQIVNYIRRGPSGRWIPIGEAIAWEYPFAPIFTCQNRPNPNEAWGRPDLTPDLIHQNGSLNFSQSNTQRIIKFHGHPKTYATGTAASQINIGIDELICLPSPDSKLANLEMTSNLDHQMTFASTIRSDMDEQSRVPGAALGRETALPRGNISGVALQLLFQPLIEKTVQKQRLYGSLIREVSRAALVLAGLLSVDDYEDYPITLHWQSLLPNDDLQAAQTALVYQQLGVSRATLLSRLGFDPEEEAEKVKHEQTQQLMNSPQDQAIAQPQETGQMSDAELLSLQADGGK